MDGKLLLDNGYKSDKSIDDCLFIYALKSGDPKELKKYIGYRCKGFDYTTAISTYGIKLETLKFLIGNGVNANSDISDTPLITAAGCGSKHILEYLL